MTNFFPIFFSAYILPILLFFPSQYKYFSYRSFFDSPKKVFANRFVASYGLFEKEGNR